MTTTIQVLAGIVIFLIGCGCGALFVIGCTPRRPHRNPTTGRFEK